MKFLLNWLTGNYILVFVMLITFALLASFTFGSLSDRLASAACADVCGANGYEYSSNRCECLECNVKEGE